MNNTCTSFLVYPFKFHHQTIKCGGKSGMSPNNCSIFFDRKRYFINLKTKMVHRINS